MNWFQSLLGISFLNSRAGIAAMSESRRRVEEFLHGRKNHTHVTISYFIELVSVSMRNTDQRSTSRLALAESARPHLASPRSHTLFTDNKQSSYSYYYYYTFPSYWMQDTSKDWCFDIVPYVGEISEPNTVWPNPPDVTRSEFVIACTSIAYCAVASVACWYQCNQYQAVWSYHERMLRLEIWGWTRDGWGKYSTI